MIDDPSSIKPRTRRVESARLKIYVEPPTGGPRIDVSVTFEGGREIDYTKILTGPPNEEAMERERRKFRDGVDVQVTYAHER